MNTVTGRRAVGLQILWLAHSTVPTAHHGRPSQCRPPMAARRHPPPNPALAQEGFTRIHTVEGLAQGGHTQ